MKNREPDRLFHPLRGASPAVARHFVRVRASSGILIPRDGLKVPQEQAAEAGGIAARLGAHDVDEAGGRIFYTSDEPSHMERHLYAIGSSARARVRRTGRGAADAEFA